MLWVLISGLFDGVWVGVGGLGLVLWFGVVNLCVFFVFFVYLICECCFWWLDCWLLVEYYYVLRVEDMYVVISVIED